MKSSDESMKKKNKIIHSVFQFFPSLKINDPDVRMIYLKNKETVSRDFRHLNLSYSTLSVSL